MPDRSYKDPLLFTTPHIYGRWKTDTEHISVKLVSADKVIN